MRNKFFYTVVFVLCLSLKVYAQEASPTDEIVIKATNAVIFQMKANLKLSDDQVSEVQPIIADTIAKTRNLQQSLEDGNIDNTQMYDQRQQLVNNENQQLGAILSPSQMKTWINIENDASDTHREREI